MSTGHISGELFILQTMIFGKRRPVLFIVLGLIIAALAGYLVWEQYIGQEETRAYRELEQRYIKAMTEDTYGGKTPRETLDLFVTALKAGDVELAAKYFMLDDNLSREKWVRSLNILKEKGVLDDMARDIEKVGFYKKIDDSRQQFVVYNEDKTDSILIAMFFNTYTGIWKIESL